MEDEVLLNCQVLGERHYQHYARADVTAQVCWDQTARAWRAALIVRYGVDVTDSFTGDPGNTILEACVNLEAVLLERFVRPGAPNETGRAA